MKELTEFVWKIENFNMYPFVDSRGLRSPFILVGNPCHSFFYLELCYSGLSSDGDKQSLYYTLNLSNGSYGGILSCEILIINPYGFNVKVPDLKFSQTSPGIKIKKEFLTLETLTLRCRIMLENVPLQYITSLEKLCQILSSLYDIKELSDLTLCTDDKEFFVHKFLLHTVAPKWFEVLEQDCEFKNGRIKVDKISMPVLQTILQYIYSGKSKTLPKEYLPELCEMFEKCHFGESTDEMIHLQEPTTLCTCINVNRKDFFWNIDISKALSDKCVLFKYIQFDHARFLIHVSVTCNQTICVHTSIQCTSLLEENILLSCKISLGKDKNHLEHHIEEKLCFSSGFKAEHLLPKQLLSKNAFNERSSLVLKFKLGFSKGEHTCSIRNMTPISPEYPSIIRNTLLKYHLCKLFHDTQRKNNSGAGDVTLYFDCDKTSTNDPLFAHRAVLAAWSPVFSCMFRLDMAEKNNGEVKISDISFATGKRLLMFMYSGEILRGTYSEDMEMYVAADKYQIKSLFGMCSEFLISHLTTENTCNILVLADKHNDESLFAAVLKCIRSNQNLVLGSNEWLSLIDTNPHLISRVLRRVSGLLICSSESIMI